MNNLVEKVIVMLAVNATGSELERQARTAFKCAQFHNTPSIITMDD